MENGIQKLLSSYKPSQQTVQLVRDTHLVLLVGISGAGKGTIREALLKTGRYHHIVSHTTRAPRENQGVMEQDGVDYHFISLDDAESLLKSGGYVEAKMYSGNVYGTSALEIQKAHDSGKIAITDLEIQGVAEYEDISDNVTAIFILPPSFEIWRDRLEKRYGAAGADPKDLNKRIETARLELQEALSKDYFEYVVNDSLDTAVDIVDKIANGNTSTRKNLQARQIAQELLFNLTS